MTRKEQAELEALVADFEHIQYVIRENVVLYHKLVRQILFGWFLPR